MAQLRDLLDRPAAKVAVVVLALAGVVAAVLAVRNMTSSEATKLSNERTFIDAATGQPFKVSLQPNMAVPVKAPSGQNTGYEAEECYWTSDGKIKAEPSYVLLNENVGKKGPTFCPDCKRRVLAHNPVPAPGDKPPPTAADLANQKNPAADEE